MKLSLTKGNKPWKRDQRFADADKKNLKLIFYAFLVGIIAGVIGSFFRIVLVYIEGFRDTLFNNAGHDGWISWLWPLLFVIIGIIVSIIIVNKFAPEAAGSGVQEIEGALDDIRPMRWKRVIPVKFFASLFSLGSGLLLGREGPTIQIGANVGKMIKDIFKQSEDKTNPLISSGAAAGLACAFNAPFAGIIFVIEEMHSQFKYNFYSIAAIMVASGTADLVVRLIVGPHPSIEMTIFQSPPIYALWMFAILGGLFSFIGYAFNKLLVVTLDIFKNISKMAILLVGIIGGIIIVIIGVYFPEVIGGGYHTIYKALGHSFTIYTLVLVLCVRFVLTILSYGIGVPGGIFAPMVALGVIFGMLYGNVMDNYFPELIPHAGVFAVAGMAGMFAAVVRAPITGLVLAIEMTSNYELILPLIITTVTASVVTAQLGNEPIYTTLLRRSLK
ncbi:MAG: H(+)/Cl(-) exchange transporter ClcA [Lentimicrobiaceae bacterium]|jgi:CIC family chloride channel protein|nr:H(+)/Cl(-) exchange transporter ClcA [Lentimicrobiaceae bacterium]MBT3454337.1 H(+)/Cl(-) exchange transporter ClcA [Lentimicrobiaceae bacterium]MBT4061555.1 H(+)/Cl(-) exchange transporter ClcA [Lentimicrobiaceae bacterium]MBT4800248.1 H(+)/Cl(-) exchange transporter ClcA [Lentimicrobiaceae bacterium]MBT5162372.1 H(+)/Cl(-) exchange transporter ClcA [Lentimicrobiaceae bacterium]